MPLRENDSRNFGREWTLGRDITHEGKRRPTLASLQHHSRVRVAIILHDAYYLLRGRVQSLFCLCQQFVWRGIALQPSHHAVPPHQGCASVNEDGNVGCSTRQHHPLEAPRLRAQASYRLNSTFELIRGATTLQHQQSPLSITRTLQAGNGNAQVAS